MFEDLQQRHSQFLGQAQWTSSVRVHLIKRCALTPHSRCLEVGCGTGVILQEWEQMHQPAWGVDYQLESLQWASSFLQSKLSAANAQNLPFAGNSFDCIFTHYFFLWAASPMDALLEIKRCLKPGGTCLILGEPDYGGRIDFPQGLELIKQLQLTTLKKLGADPCIGRKLKGILSACGFHSIYGGILGSEWQDRPDTDTLHATDLQNILYDAALSGLGVDPLKLTAIDQKARLEGSRVIFVPTFFFSAQK